MSKIVFNVTPWSEYNMEKYQWLDTCLQNQPSSKKEFNPRMASVQILAMRQNVGQ